MTDREATEVTKTSIVRKRNENGYLIHPGREDTGKTDRHFGVVMIVSALIGLAFFGPAIFSYSLLFALFGLHSIRKGRKKRRRVGGYRR
jgi:hypothetical protein